MQIRHYILGAIAVIIISLSAGCSGKIDTESAARKASGSDLVAAYRKAKDERDRKIYSITHDEINHRGGLLDRIFRDDLKLPCERYPGCVANPFAGAAGGYVTSFNIALLESGAWEKIKISDGRYSISSDDVTKLKNIVREMSSL